jgi:predicted O-methyltransferase YrrM
MLNIMRDTGEFLAALVKATNATRVLEIGTSKGYSTLGLARAVRSSGKHPDESRTENLMVLS